MKLIKKEKSGTDYILTFEKTPTFFERFSGKKTETIKYIGSSTVWWTYPDFKRAGTMVEYHLSGVYKKIKHEELHGEIK